MRFDLLDRLASLGLRRSAISSRTKKQQRKTSDSIYRRPQFESLEERRVLSTFTLGTSALVEPAAAGSDTDLLFGSGAWTASPVSSWLHLSSPNQSGTGSALVTFTFDANPNATARNGTLTIAGQTLTVTQAGTSYVAAAASALVSGLNSPSGVAVDGSGNVFIADYGDSAIKEWVAATGTVSTLVSTGLSGPLSVAVDGSGNVYIADTGNKAIKEWVKATSTVTTLVSSGLDNPEGVAVDGSGNVYIADGEINDALKEWVAATSTVTTLVSSGLIYINGVAVDGSGNVYIAVDGDDTIKEWVAATSTVTTLVSSGLDYPFGVAVDGSGNVYIADALIFTRSIKEWVAATGTLSTLLVSSGLNAPSSVAVDGSGDVYFAENSNIKELPRAYVGPTTMSEESAAGSDALLQVLPSTENLSGTLLPTSDQNWLTIGAITGGVVSFSFAPNPTTIPRMANISILGQSISVTQAPATILGTASLVESAAAGTDTDVLAVTYPLASWTASANNNWLHVSGGNASGTGSATVLFTFDANPNATPRTGTLTIGGRTLSVTQAGTGYTSTAALFGLNGPTNLVSTGLNGPENVAVDGSSNVYIADTGNNAVKEWLAASNTVTTLVSTGLNAPTGVAVDAFGNVYIADSGDNAIKEWLAPSNTVTTLVSSGLSGPYGLALDTLGNVYFSDTGNSAIKEWLVASNTVTTLVATGLSSPKSIAVDVTGDVFIADSGNKAIKEWSVASQTVSPVVTGLSANPQAVAIDGSGNVYYLDSSGSVTINEWVAATSTVTTLLTTSLLQPVGLAVDALGNAYGICATSGLLVELPRAFVGPANTPDTLAAWTDSLPAVLPTTENLSGPFLPTSSNPSWLTVGAISGGVVNYSFTATASTRTANITVLGVPVAVTQQQLFQQSGTTLTVLSNPAYEHLQVIFSDASNFTVTLEGTSQSFTTAQVNKVIFAGADANATAIVIDAFNTLTSAVLTPTGMTVKAAAYEIDVTSTPTNTISGSTADTATLSGTTGTNQFYGKPAVSQFVNTGAGTTYTETVDNFGTVNAASSSSSDVAYLYDNTGTNTFTASPTTANMNGTGYAYNVTAFPVVYAMGSAVNNDTAYLSDAAGGLFNGFQTSAVSYGTGYYNYASNFKVVFDTMASANNQAFLYDTSGANVFERHNAAGSTPAYSVFYDPAGSFYNLVINSQQVTATAAAGTTDQAYLNDNTDNSQLYGTANSQLNSFPTYTLLSPGGTTNFLVNSFGNVQTTETGTSNTENAYMYVSLGDRDRFYGLPPGFQGQTVPESQLAGTTFLGITYSSVAIGFGQSYGIANGSPFATAYLYAAPNNGTFYGGNDLGNYQDTMQGTGYYYAAEGFHYVFGLGAGGDTAFFTDADAFAHDIFEGHQSYSVLHSIYSDLYVYAGGFTTVNATGGGFDFNPATGDTAFLYDAPTNDYIIAAGDNAQLGYNASGPTPATQINVAGFDNVQATSSLGGTDKKYISAVDYNLLVTGNWQ
jgi:DNA-binding beta-propeller fold protein YncE